jgi:thymidylate kinase
MIYILEGPDGSGKTTYANSLSKMTKYKVKHFSYPVNDAANDTAMFNEYADILKHSNNIIIDRCWYSEMCYGPALRGITQITYPQMYELESIAASKGALIVYCTDSKANLWSRATARGEEYITDKEVFSTICDAYEELFRIPHIIPVVRYKVAFMF